LQASEMQFVWSAVEMLRLTTELHGEAGRFVRGQQLISQARARAANDRVARELTLIGFGLDVRALERGGSSSLGRGLSLFQASQKQLIAAAQDAQDHEFRRRLVETLYRLYRAAKEAKLSQAGSAAIAFTQKELPVLLDRQIDSHQELVNDAARMLRDVASPRDALAFYISRLEVEPSWLARRGERGWQRFAWEMGSLFDDETVRYRLGDLEPRLLKLVLAELRRDLVRQNYNQRTFYHSGFSHFWKEKTDEFARVAEEVLAQQRDSLTAVNYIADYLYSGIQKHDRGIAVLLDAHRRGLLDQDGRGKLVVWLQEQSRFGESIALLEPLVEQEPGVLQFRLQLMHAYFRTQQPEALRTLLTETDKYFHGGDRWNEDVAGQLANSCLENQLLEQAVDYLKEAIARREELLGGRTTRDQKLAQYYVDRAYAYAGLKNTPAAVDDAASALVVWGAAGDGIYRRNARTDWRHSGYVHPLDVLKEVLSDSPNLDDYVAELDRQVAASGQDRPAVRKALGEAYAEKKAWDKAIAQLKLAVELAPNDGAIHAKLVEAYRETGDKKAETAALFASVELAKRDIELWTKLAALLDELKQPAEAERARTSLVEVLPQETEGHQKLAQIREEQARLEEAILEWQHVARLRKLEPTGLLGLAAVQIKQKDRAAAEGTLRQLDRTDWPQRFRNQLQEQLPKLREAAGKL
jgi:tetratricopeptide (TPR) repeat protein